MSGADDNWMPLQSNPQVINPFINKLGMKLDQFSFQQMMSTEDWALQMIPQPALGVMFLYQVTQPQTDHRIQQEQGLVPANIPENVFFMKQNAMNACGTIALFHIIINSSDAYPHLIAENSFLSKFKEDAHSKHPDSIGDMLRLNEQIQQEHKSAANQGQSEVVDAVNTHFIAFIEKNGHLYQLDGMKKCAIDHGEATGGLLVKAAAVIRDFMARDPNNNNYTMSALAKNP